MSLILFSANGMPGLINSDDLPSIDDNRCAARLIEIASALEREGVEGIHVQCIPVEGGRFVHALNLLAGSFGERIIEFFADHARKHKRIFSVNAALQIARAAQESEASNG